MTKDILTAQLQKEARKRMTDNILWRDTETKILEKHFDAIITDTIAAAVQRAREELLENVSKAIEQIKKEVNKKEGGNVERWSNEEKVVYFYIDKIQTTVKNLLNDNK